MLLHEFAKGIQWTVGLGKAPKLDAMLRWAWSPSITSGIEPVPAADA
jgi:hypothetical protein